MEYVNLGRTGLKVSRLCLGAMTYGSKTWRKWMLEEEESRPFLKHALELGINFIDTADMYSLGVSEEIVGRAVRDFGPGRDRLAIATKVFNPMGDDPNLRGLSRKHIMHSIDDSLRRLGTDYVDLYQIHRFDYSTPIEETIAALDDVVRAGKVRYLGASAMFAWQFEKMLCTADRLGRTRFVSMQNHYNVVYREEEREMMPLCREEGIGVIPFSPMARGFVNGKSGSVRQSTDELTPKYYNESDYAVVDAVTAVAQARGVNNAQVALAWLLHQSGVTAPIIGASKPHHLDDAVAAISLKLSAEELNALAAPYRPHGILAHS
jgi:aryl-alcohol dehydrogenase-like predicted oxidoreductase